MPANSLPETPKPLSTRLSGSPRAPASRVIDKASSNGRPSRRKSPGSVTIRWISKLSRPSATRRSGAHHSGLGSSRHAARRRRRTALVGRRSLRAGEAARSCLEQSRSGSQACPDVAPFGSPAVITKQSAAEKASPLPFGGLRRPRRRRTRRMPSAGSTPQRRRMGRVTSETVRECWHPCRAS